MKDPALYFESWRRWMRSHERPLTIAYVGLLGLGVAVVVPTPLRDPAQRAVEIAVERLDERWTARVERGERLVAEKRFEEAATFLAALDARFPARDVKHARDDERKRVLRALAEAEDSLGRKRATLAALGRLVEFDPRDYTSRLTFAEAARRLGEDDAALEAYASVLAIHPMEPTSLRHVLQYRVDAGDFPGARGTFDRFVESLVTSRVDVALDSVEASEYVPVDGRFRDVVFRVEAPPGWSGDLRLTTEGFGVEIAEIRVEPPLRVGLPGASRVTLEAAELPRALERMIQIRQGVFQGAGPRPAVTLTLPPRAREARRIAIRLRLLKLVDEEAWWLAETSYRNVLELDRFDEVGDRVLACSSGAAGGLPPCAVITWPGEA